MSDVMLLGVLGMPRHCWDRSELDEMQRESYYQQAAARIQSDADRIAALEAVLRDEAISLLANAYDNLNDMPISEDWAAKTAKRILELLARIDALLPKETR